MANSNWHGRAIVLHCHAGNHDTLAYCIYYCSDTSKAVTGKCTTTFRAEPTNSQTPKKSRNDLPNDSSDCSSEADSANNELNDDLSEGLGSDGEAETDQTGTDQSSLHPVVSSGDFGKVVQLKDQRELSDREKYYLLKHHFVPGKGYSSCKHLQS